ncbi:MAG: hypothetical protein J5I57_01070 [Melioribacteraceae bacterium]|nr:hypothetical protein [Melioribacteraceae bacterium]
MIADGKLIGEATDQRAKRGAKPDSLREKAKSREWKFSTKINFQKFGKWKLLPK